MADEPKREKIRISTDQIVQKVKELIREGNVQRLIVQNEEGKTLMEIPMTFVVIGVMAAPILAALGALAGILANCTLIIERKD